MATQVPVAAVPPGIYIGPTGQALVVTQQAGATYTFALADAGTVVESTNATGATFTLPLNSSVAFGVPTEITALDGPGSGVLTVTGAAGVTLNGVSGGSVATTGAYQAITLIQTAANTWVGTTGSASGLSNPVTIPEGGTGATTAAAAQANLGVVFASTIRQTTGTPSSLSTDQAGDFAYDPAACIMYGPFSGNGTSGTWPSGVSLPPGVPGGFFISGKWYPQVTVAGTPLLMVENTGYAMPFYVGRARAFNAISTFVTVVGTSGVNIRMGVYADNGSGYPGALVVDGGIASGSTLNSAVAYPSVTLQPGLYWLTSVSQNAGTQPTVHTAGGPIPGSSPFGNTYGASFDQINGYSVASLATGALPGTFLAGGTPIANCPYTNLGAA